MRFLASTRSASAVLALLLLGACGEGLNSVTRSVDGVPYEGRIVSSEAYAAYLRGSELEASGKLREALIAYRRALEEDPDSPEIFARIGSLRCRLAKPAENGPNQARAAFASALAIDPENAGALLERARCLAAAGDPTAALVDARRALNANPLGEDINLFIAELFDQLEQPERARAWLEALATRADASLAVLRALEELRSRDASTETADPIDDALALGDLALAKTAAIDAHASLGELSLRAVRLGQSAFALEQAELVLGADPSNADAWVAALVACDFLPDRARFEKLLARDEAPKPPLSALGQKLLASLLMRHVGTSAATALRLPDETAPKPK